MAGHFEKLSTCKKHGKVVEYFALANAAGALVVSGLVDELGEGVELAAKTVDSGKAEEKLKNLIKFSQANHQQG